jgi:hypothetical protein
MLKRLYLSKKAKIEVRSVDKGLWRRKKIVHLDPFTWKQRNLEDASEEFYKGCGCRGEEDD